MAFYLYFYELDEIAALPVLTVYPLAGETSVYPGCDRWLWWTWHTQLELKWPFMALGILWKAGRAEVGCRKIEVSQDMWLLGYPGGLAGQGWTDAPQGGPGHTVTAFQASQHTWDAPVHSNLVEKEYK